MLYLKRDGLLKTFTEVGWFIFYYFGYLSLNKITGGKSKGDVNNDHENTVSKKKSVKWQKKADCTLTEAE